MAKSKPPRDDLIDWFTITYKSIYIVIGVVVARWVFTALTAG